MGEGNEGLITTEKLLRKSNVMCALQTPPSRQPQVSAQKKLRQKLPISNFNLNFLDEDFREEERKEEFSPNTRNITQKQPL